VPSTTTEDSSAATAPTWQLSTGEIKEAIDSGSNIDLDDPAAGTPTPRPRQTGPLWKSARRLLLGVVWAGLLVALTAVMVGRTTGRPPVPAIGTTEPFTFPPDQTSSDRIATTPDDDESPGQQQIPFPASPPLPEPEEVAPPAKKGAVKTPRRQGPKSPSKSPSRQPQVVIPEQKPAEDRQTLRSAPDGVCRGRLQESSA
jgi:hypothetical protein